MFPCGGYLQLAKRLAAINDEVSLRNAVSRAYYASHHKAKLFALNNHNFFNNKGSKIHKEVINFLARHGNVNVRLLSAELDRLRKNRNKCDYDDIVRGLEKMAENAIISAEEIFNSIT